MPLNSTRIGLNVAITESDKRKSINKTVLIVDDEIGIRDAIAECLVLDGFKTITASGGNAALEIVKSQAIDIIVTDLRMPDGNGVELLKAVKILFPNLPLVVITGFSDYLTIDLENMGASQVFPKPFNMPELSSYLFLTLNLLKDQK